MKYLVVLYLLVIPFVLNAQKTAVYTDELSSYKDGMDLFDKEKYVAAQNKFNKVIELINDNQDEISINAQYYSAVCALELFNRDAENLLNEFVKQHPESPKVQRVYFQLGKYYYRRKKWDDAVEWYEKVDKFKLSKEELAEYYFKKGYSHFQEEEYKEAGASFIEIKETESEYQAPSLYYYSHIAYHDKNYQTALEGFSRIKDKKGFNTIVPYYIVQIYYLQNRHDKVLEYGPALLDSIKPQKADEISGIIGDSYYQKQKYDEAVPYLLRYHKGNSTSREEKYQLAYCHYRSASYKEAIPLYGKVNRVKDKLGQLASYQLADCYQKIDEKSFAMNAFKDASELDFDPEIQEDALFNFAVLAYELSANPYDDAITAFESYIQTYPNSSRKSDAYQYLVNVYMTTKNYTEALNSLDKLNKNDDIRLQSAYQMVTYNRGVELFINDKYNSAIEMLKKVKTYPIDKKLNAESKYWIAEAYYAQGKYLNAITSFKSFIAEPGSYGLKYYSQSHYDLGFCYYNRKEYKKAIEEYRQYVSLEKNDFKKINDAYLRTADAYFLEKDDKQAIKYYSKAIELNERQKDYAMFQKAMSEGYLGEHDNKIKTLNSLISSFSATDYKVNAKFELGESNRIIKNYNQALKHYEDVVEQYPNNLLSKKALLYMAQINFVEKDYNASERIYLRILNNNPDNQDCHASLEGLKDVYAATDKIDEWGNLTKMHDCGSGWNVDSVYFSESIEKFYLEADCDKVISNGAKFIKSSPNSYYITTANYYVAECLFSQDKKDEALVYYENVLAKPNNSHTETSLQRASNMLYNLEQHQKALAYFEKLEKIATKELNLLDARIGKMNCNYYLKNYTAAKENASKVIKNANTPEYISIKAHLIEGMSYFYLGDYDKAEDELLQTNELTKTITGAEARYHVCLIYNLQGDYKKSEEDIFEFVKQKPTYSYWIAKAYILLADNYVHLGDNFQAKQTLRSIIEHYKNDDDIVPLAEEKLAEIIEAENAEEEEKNTRSMTIDLGEGEEETIKGEENETIEGENNENTEKDEE